MVLDKVTLTDGFQDYVISDDQIRDKEQYEKQPIGRTNITVNRNKDQEQHKRDYYPYKRLSLSAGKLILHKYSPLPGKDIR